MTLTTDLGLSIRVSMFEHVDWWLGPLPRSPGMGEGGDWWSWPLGIIAKGIPRGCQGLFTPVSLGYPLSVLNKNSTLKGGSGVWCQLMLRVYGFVFGSTSLLSAYMCVRMSLSLRSIAGEPSSLARPGYLITAHHLSRCVPDVLGALAVWRHHDTKKNSETGSWVLCG